MRLFDSNDAEYLTWLASNPKGFVVNSERNPRPQNIVVHRATCRSISRSRAAGAYTERQYIKVCGDSIAELSSWVKQYREDGSFSSECPCIFRA